MNSKNVLLLLSLTLVPLSAHADWRDWLSNKADEVVEKAKSNESVKKLESSLNVDTALNNEQIAKGLKEALAKGADYAVAELGNTGGFLNNKNLKIPMPSKLQKVEQILRKAGQDKYADEFVNTMNTAAEQAVPLSLNILKAGIENMTLEDAQNILNGNNDAATQYLKRVGSDNLRQQISPIVKEATAKTGVTKIYKKMYDKMGFAGQFLNLEDYDIDSYVTTKTMDGLFVKIADEEKKIRENPSARTSEILKQVFGD